MRGTRRGLEVGTLLLVGTIAATGTLRGQTPDAIKWGPPPPAMPAGAMVAVMAGDPAKAGEMFILRIKVPGGYHVAPHTHPGDEHLTVIKGTFMLGMGEKFDDKALKSLPAGSHAEVAKEMAHFAATKGETIVEVSGIGPFVIKYVNPNDDPSAKKTAP